MRSRLAGPLTVIANLAAFSACACLAFARNINALFYGDNCNMVGGDAQAVLVKMIEAVRGLGLAAAA